jgi:hypothetical protein
MRVLLLFVALSVSACSTTPQTQRDIYADVLDENLKQARGGSAPITPYKIAAGDDELALRATPSSAVVADVYSWVHSSDYVEIENRLLAEIPNTTARLYNRQNGMRVKYTGPSTSGTGDVYYWSRNTGQIRRGSWEIKEGKFGPQICETFYGETTCLNTVEQLSGVGRIDRRKGDVFGLARGVRPEVGDDGLPEWD